MRTLRLSIYIATAFSFTLLHGQTTSATLSGLLVDPSGAAMSKATVSVLHLETGTRRTATTEGAGEFNFTYLPPGKYQLRAQHEGFAVAEYNNITLNVSDNVTLRVPMQLATATSTVNVVEDAQAINLTGSVATTMDRKFIENMPLSGRSLQSLFDLTPGVLRSAGIEAGQFVVNGQRADANYFQVDGVSANTAVNPLGSGIGMGGTLPSLSVLNTTNTMVSLDALQEFKIQTSTYAPEFGRTPGGQVSLVTRSGTNRFTGTLFEYFRNDKLDANDWFANRGGAPRPPQRQNDFGGVLGGPIVRNKTFFFVSHEVLLVRLPQTASTFVPSLATRNGSIPAMKSILNSYPLPTGPDSVTAQGVLTGSAAYTTSYADPTRMDTFGLRIDQNLGTYGSLFGRYSAAPSSNSTRTLGMASLRSTERTSHTATLGHIWAKANLANDLRFNFTSTTGLTVSRLDKFGGAVPVPEGELYPAFANSDNSSMTFQINFGAEIPSLASGRSADNGSQQFNIVEGFAVNRGRHAFKFGMDYRRLAVDFRVSTSLSPNFPTIANLMAGLVPSYSVTARQPGIRPVLHNTSLFAQDTWRATQRLTLTYGLRWELNPPPQENNGHLLTTLVGTGSPDTLDVANGIPFYPMRWGNLAPRLGLAYQLRTRAGRETTLRGGFGLYYDLGASAALQGYEGYPYRITVNYPNVQFPLSSSPQVVLPEFRTTPPYTTTLGYDPSFVSPRSMQWNVTLEQNLSEHQTLSLAYVAAAGRDLTRTELYTRPNPRFGDSVAVTRNQGSSDYSSMQLQYRRRFQRGLQVTASYTLSHSTDTASTGAVITNVPILFAEAAASKADSDFDVRNNFAAAVSYNLPWFRQGRSIFGGFALDTLIKARGATPVNILGRSLSAPFSGSLRPNRVPDQPLYLESNLYPGGRRLNSAAFTLAPVGVQGDVPRNYLRGFGARQIDVALRREFRLWESVKLQFRAEAFNILNTPNFANPSGTLSSSAFGLSSQMLNRSLRGISSLYELGGPRSGQLALKILF
jgi:hypothetical protein